MVCVIYTRPVGDLGASRHTPSSKPVRRSTAVRVRGAWAWGAGYGRRAVSAAPGMAKPDPGPGASARFFSCPPRTIKPPPVAWAAQAPQHPEVRELASPPCVGSVRRPRAGVEPPARPRHIASSRQCGVGWTGFVVVDDRYSVAGGASRDAGLDSRRWRGGSTRPAARAVWCTRLAHSPPGTSYRHFPTARHSPRGRSCPAWSDGPRSRGPERSTGVSIWWTPHGCFSQKRRRRRTAPRLPNHRPYRARAQIHARPLVWLI